MTRSRWYAMAGAAVLAAGLILAHPAAEAVSKAERADAAGARAPAPTPVSETPFTLSADYDKYAALIDRLSVPLPPVSVATVMANANLNRQPLCNTSGLTAPVDGFCWETEDDASCHNVPQGITTTRDATGGEYNGHQLVAVSWYYRDVCEADAPNTRSRITLVDWDADQPNKYRKVLLVEPKDTADGPSFTDVGIHAGGVSWYGHYLYVADTDDGMRVFDMRTIMETDTTGDGIGLQPGGAYQAHGYRYVLPQMGTIDQVGETGDTALRWSAIGLDRAQPSLVTADYGDATFHSVRFPLNPATNQLVVGAGGLVHATQALSVPYHRVQGVVSHNGRWWWGSSGEKELYYWVPGQATATAHPWVSWCEGLSYWEDGTNPDLLWSLRENTGDRSVFVVQQQNYD